MPWNTPPQSVRAKRFARTICRPRDLPSARCRRVPEAGMDRALQQWVAARVAAGATYKQIHWEWNQQSLSICFTTSTTNRPFSLAS